MTCPKNTLDNSELLAGQEIVIVLIIAAEEDPLLTIQLTFFSFVLKLPIDTEPHGDTVCVGTGGVFVGGKLVEVAVGLATNPGGVWVGEDDGINSKVAEGVPGAGVMEGGASVLSGSEELVEAGDVFVEVGLGVTDATEAKKLSFTCVKRKERFCELKF